MIRLEVQGLFGYDQVDVQHKQFIDLLKSLNINLTDAEKAERIVKELYLFTQYHFTSEENIMADHDYPLLSAHKKTHNKLTFDLRSKKALWKNREITTKQLLDFLVEWFIDHTMYQDELFAKHIRNSM